MLEYIDLSGKKILLGVSASISIYKSLELIRLFIKSGAQVRVVMSEEAKRFITPLTFEALSGNKVLHQETESWENAYNHIAMGKWADVFVIAPASANTINKLSNGIADTLLTQTALAYPRTKILAPAANTNMIQNPITQVSLKMLKLMHYEILGTQVKSLVCKDAGDGALASVEEIFFATSRVLLREPFWEYRRVVISGGGTVERIDDVRYISNFSSGKMASALAIALYLKGADVCLVTSKNPTVLPRDVHVIDVEATCEYVEFLNDALRVAKKGLMSKPTLIDNSTPQLIVKKPYLFMAAAVSDYVPTFPQRGKLKKEMLGDTWELSLKKNVDVLMGLDKQGVVSIGFKAEMDETVALINAQKMVSQKGLDAVCLNIIAKENPFGGDANAMTYVSATSSEDLGKSDKLHMAMEILERVKQHDA